MSVAYDLDFCPDVVRVAPRPALRPVPAWSPLAPQRLAGVTYLVPPRQAAPLRLTRRGARVLALVALTVAVALVAAAWQGGAEAAPARSVPAGTSVTVGPDGTLWSIATAVAPGRDPRAEVADLERVNHLSGPIVHPGDVLVVP